MKTKQTTVCGTSYNTLTMYVVFQNTDLTEGRGVEVPIAVCINPITAEWIGKGQEVMGANCSVRPVDLIQIGDTWYGPDDLTFKVQFATKEDVQEYQKLEKQREVYKKMRLAGISKEDIAPLLRPEAVEMVKLVEAEIG